MGYSHNEDPRMVWRIICNYLEYGEAFNTALKEAAVGHHWRITIHWTIDVSRLALCFKARWWGTYGLQTDALPDNLHKDYTDFASWEEFQQTPEGIQRYRDGLIRSLIVY